MAGPEQRPLVLRHPAVQSPLEMGRVTKRVPDGSPFRVVVYVCRHSAALLNPAGAIRAVGWVVAGASGYILAR